MFQGDVQDQNAFVLASKSMSAENAAFGTPAAVPAGQQAQTQGSTHGAGHAASPGSSFFKLDQSSPQNTENALQQQKRYEASPSSAEPPGSLTRATVPFGLSTPQSGATEAPANDRPRIAWGTAALANARPSSAQAFPGASPTVFGGGQARKSREVAGGAFRPGQALIPEAANLENRPPSPFGSPVSTATVNAGLPLQETWPDIAMSYMTCSECGIGLLRSLC